MITGDITILKASLLILVSKTEYNRKRKKGITDCKSQ